MTAITILFLLLIGAAAQWVVSTFIKNGKLNDASEKPPTPEVAVEIIRELRPEIFEKAEPSALIELANSPVEPETEIGPFTASDLSDFLAAYGSTGSTWDLNQDGFVGISDLTILLANYGTQKQAPYDIVPVWNNYYNHLPATNQTSGFALYPTVRDEGVKWDDIKEECTVKWFFEGKLASENKDVCPIFEAVTNAGLCSGQFPFTCEITHTPSGKVFSRTAVTHINLTEQEGWHEVNPDMKECDLVYDYGISDIENLWAGPFEDYQFLIN